MAHLITEDTFVVPGKPCGEKLLRHCLAYRILLLFSQWDWKSGSALIILQLLLVMMPEAHFPLVSNIEASLQFK